MSAPNENKEYFESSQHRRRHDTQGKSEGGYACRYDEDRDRIFYSSAFRRLAGVTQVAPATESRLLHNRLTHSVKVAQVGRRLADLLINDPTLGKKSHKDIIIPSIIETAGLAHDLGHPPFGHVAETVLDDLMSAVEGLEGFEGNAQTFRIVTKLSVRNDEEGGLDLTRGSLDAILKYPRLKENTSDEEAGSGREWSNREYGTKWGCYESEADYLDWVRGENTDDSRCAAAMLVDWADDITYAIHDVEDYYRAGLIPLHKIEDDLGKIATHGAARLTKAGHKGFNDQKFHKSLESLLQDLPFKRPFTGTRYDRQRLYDFMDSKMRHFVCGAVAIKQAPYVKIRETFQYEVEALKELTWYYVIHHPSLALAQEGQKKVIRELFNTLADWLTSDVESPRIPRDLADLYSAIGDDHEVGAKISKSKDAKIARAVCDYICTLTDQQTFDMYERLLGISRASIFGSMIN
ncbi:dNTP triphosphohydrolase [Streptomyces sp. NBC_00461]|uniref:deoxyguanosinetriphosphate triphosphohydrolase family protein n=1 Tax=Streptomyces sp. NBC_00461 TaxID=2975750 RepID=UPI002E18AAF2